LGKTCLSFTSRWRRIISYELVGDEAHVTEAYGEKAALVLFCKKQSSPVNEIVVLVADMKAAFWIVRFVVKF